MSAKVNIKDFGFSGQWLPGPDPLKIGDQNFANLENYRHGDNGIERTGGYSKINTTALTTYYKGRSSIQLCTPHTAKTYVLVQEYDIDLSASVIKKNTTAIPDAGEFTATAVHTDASGAKLGRFSKLPSFNIGYCNEVESCVWAGDETRCAAFIRIASLSGLTLTSPADFSVQINNTLQTTDNTVALSGANLEFLIASTRPLKAMKLYVETANDTASTLTGEEWTGAAWSAITLTDGTKPGTISCAQTGIVSFDSTVATSKACYINGMLLYFYHFTLSVGSVTLYHVTVDAPFQDIVDVWDGIYRTCIQFQLSRSSTYEDYTLEVNEPSTQQYPISALLGGMTSGDSIVVMFQDRQVGLKWAMIGGRANDVTATTTIKYWNGGAFATVGTVSDGTLANGKTLNQSGVMTWNPPTETLEVARELFGVYGYAYEITVSATLNGKAAVGTHTTGANAAALKDTTQEWLYTELYAKTVNNITDGSSGPITANTDQVVTATLAGGTDDDWDVDDVYTITPFKESVYVDTLIGIPAQRTMRPYRFPFIFQNRSMLCGDVVGKEEHRVDYGATNGPDVYNGDDSSALGRALYFGSGGSLEGACEIYNRFGSNILDTALFFKSTSTYLLNGTGPYDFRIYKISSNYGCPAPLTISTAEVGYEVAPDVLRNISLWLSYQGPILFDAAVIIPIPGIEIYFDPRRTTCINFDYIHNSRAWFDATNIEWNLLIPSGTDQQACNVWLVYDLRRKRWYKKNTNDAAYPQDAVIVEDLGGRKYVYCHTDDGYLMNVEDGSSWAGETIEFVVRSADILPFDTSWVQSRITQFKFLTQVPAFIDSAPTASITISIEHFKNGETVSTSLEDIVISKSDYMTENLLVNEDNDRIVTEDGDSLILNMFEETRHFRKTQAVSLKGWSHQFEFLMDSDDYEDIGSYSRNFLGWAFQAELIREDL